MVFLRLLRIRHWIKNLLIILPTFFAGKLFDYQDYHSLFIGFISFSLVASSIYIFNDLFDLKEDRNHPYNKYRPLASGQIKKNTAISIAISLLVIAFTTVCVMFDGIEIGLLISYLVINLFYSYKLKEIPVLDVFILASGFILRVVYGGALTGTSISKWLILMIFLLSLFIGFAKRRSDLTITDGNTIKRKVLEGYNLIFLDAVILINVGISIVCHIMYTVSNEITQRLGNENNIYLSSIFVFYGTIKYLQNVYVFNNGLSPVDILWKDRHIQVTVLAWLSTYAYFIYA